MLNSIGLPKCGGCRSVSSWLANRNVSLLLLLAFCFLLIANQARCDQVGSASGRGRGADSHDQQVAAAVDEMSRSQLVGSNSGSREKPDPLSMLREIYLDHNSKIITMLLPPIGADSGNLGAVEAIETTATQAPSAPVAITAPIIAQPSANQQQLRLIQHRAPAVMHSSIQKFHPNGRYGRRSVNDFTEASESRVELAKLRPSESGSAQTLSSLLRTFAANRNQQQQQQQQQRNELIPDASARTNDLISAANYQQELNKLLRCNYTGISDLYWCNTGN